MPAIGEMEYGVDASQVETYLDEIRAIVLTEATAAVNDFAAVTSQCEENWEGQARDDFVESLKEDAGNVADIYSDLYDTLSSEINQIAAAMINKDKSLLG